MIELMVVMVVLTIVATATMARLGLHSLDSSYRTYTDDVYGAIIFARAKAVDDQTRVILTMQGQEISVEQIDPVDGSRDLIRRHQIARYGGGVMKDRVCNAGMFNGVLAPGEKRSADPSATSPGSACSSKTEQIIFQPEGSFVFQGQAGPPSGVTMLVRKKSGGNVMGSVIEVYPGGNVRKVDNVHF